MPVVHFSEAVRKGSHVLVFVYGESGCGKTYSSLLLARGLVGPKGKIALIDTETGRGSLYADDPEIGGYIYGELTPPFSPERYIEALRDAEEAGADAVVIDSLSHEWTDIGGVLEIADENEQKKNYKGLVKWAAPKARHKRFVKALLRTRLHVIGCMRAKEKFAEVMVRDSDGREKKSIASQGFVPEQDKLLKFEATVQLFLPNRDPIGVPVVEKCHKALTSAFPTGEQIGIGTGQRIRQWLDSAAPIDEKFERVKREAEDHANEGTTALRDFWHGLTKDQQRQLKPQMDNLKSIAAEADRRAAEEELRGGDDHDAETGEVTPSRVLRDEQKLDDPFSDAPPRHAAE